MGFSLLQLYLCVLVPWLRVIQDPFTKTCLRSRAGTMAHVLERLGMHRSGGIRRRVVDILVRTPSCDRLSAHVRY